jgi:adenylate cyclase
MQASLCDNENGQLTELGEVLMIGRRDGCQLQIKETKVSRQHAMIRREDNGYWFYDLGSSNGSYLNGRRIMEGEKLVDGDQVKVGGRDFTFRSGQAMGPAADADEFSLDATLLDIRTVPVLMLVSDLKGFTEISERMPPEELAAAIGAWYRECKVVLGECGATLDKFIGDAVLAYWLDVSEVSRRQALVAARRLTGCCEKIFDEHRGVFEGAGANLRIGTGLHLGKVAHGKMGRDAFTLIGDAVNATFRLEALTRTLGGDVLVSDAFLDGWWEGYGYCESRGSHLVKGKSVPMEVFVVKTWPDGVD